MKKFLIAAIAASVMSGAAYAGTGNASRTVSYGDLDLGRPAGAQSMLRRINNAAESVCGGRADFRALKAMAANKACIREATANALLDLNAPLVTSIHNSSVDIIDVARN